jgi:hypothetical protein
MRELCSAGQQRTAARNFFDAKEIPVKVFCHYELVPYSRIVLDKLTVTQSVKK